MARSSLRKFGGCLSTLSNMVENESSAGLDLANSNVNRTVGLVSSSLAILTFILFFLYPSYSSGRINPILFQTTLILMVLTIFCFGFSGLYFYGITRDSTMTSAKARAFLQRGEMFFVLGLLFGLIVPALILFTIGLAFVGGVATVLWLAYSYFVVQQARAPSQGP